MQDPGGSHQMQETWLESADPAALKEFVEREALAALAQQPNAVNLWETLVWTFVLTSAPRVRASRRAQVSRSSLCAGDLGGTLGRVFRGRPGY